ncbi:hypothetical protein LshimejAT787_1204860 [Lyophyllum shimeji]|uniref:Uncharacterized protein n=1 Tax=Lyophyllum shimeji TaxID=47721 RepID=A0A9P3PXG2_LYOSH|nr:hypothetical protein LshimejAT787_1204860 [Lyophyllum shimeji]
MAQPLAQPAQGLDSLDLTSLARATTKTFERLAPFSLLRDPSSHDASPTVIKIVDKIKSYLAAIDTTMQVVHAAYQMSKLASTLWTAHASRNGNGRKEKRSTSSSFAADAERQKRLEDLVLLADAASDQASKTSGVFKQVQQDFYRIAAWTKDMDATVQIPVDPSLPKTIKKPLRDVGSDLVANLGLLAEFSRHTSELASWCAWVKVGIIKLDGTVVPPQAEPQDDNDTDDDGAGIANATSDGGADKVRAKWEQVRRECLLYYSLIAEMQARYAEMLPLSVELWQQALREANTKEETKAQPPGGVRRKVSSLFRDAVRTNWFWDRGGARSSAGTLLLFNLCYLD